VSSRELPAGTVTFLFTDIEGSTQLLKRLGGDRYAEALGDHQRLLREAFAEHDGHEIDTQGDSFFVAFGRAKDAVSCAIACQRQLAEHTWPEGTELRVRMGIHTGEPAMGGQRYVGLGVNRGARIAAVGHGGQVLVSQTTRELLRDDPVQEDSLRDLGEHQLKDMDGPERIFQLVAPGLETDFPELKTAASTPFEGREGELAQAAAEEMAKRWRRPGRRTLILATFGAALVGAMLGVLLTQGGDSNANASVSANAVGVIDPDGGDIAAEVPVGTAPGGVAAGADAIWVTSTGDNTVSRIDRETSELRQTIPVGGAPTGVAVGGGAVWVADSLDGTVTRIDEDTNLPSQTITVGNGPSGVAFGAGVVWVTNSTDGTVSRIDSTTGRVRQTYPAIVGASALTIAFDRLWIVSPPSGRVAALDLRSGRLVKEIGVGGDPSAISAGGDAVWVTNRADGTVSRIDPETLAVADVVPVGGGPVGVAAGESDVWVANGVDGTLSRFESANVNEVESTSLENPPKAIALASEGVYVAVGSSGAEHRGGTLDVISGELDSVDPALAYSTDSWSVLTMTNDGLVGFRKVGGAQGTQLVPDLATALPQPTDGGRVYTFQIRRDIRYSNGEVVQPADFRRGLERVFELGSPGAPYYGGIVGAGSCTKGTPCDLSRGVVADRPSYSVTIRLVEPDGDFLTKLAMPWAYAVPMGTAAKPASGANPVPATGPYRIAGYREKSKTYRLTRNARFREWSTDAQPDGFPDVITVSARFGFLATDHVAAVRRGTGDIALGAGPPIPSEELDQLAARFPSRLRLNTAFATEYFFLNTRVEPFDDVRVRRAIAYAFDAEAYVDQARGVYAPACKLLPPNFPAYAPTCPFETTRINRLGRARALVQAAGVEGARVTVWVPQPQQARGEYLASILELLEFRAVVRTIPIDRTGGASKYFGTVADSSTGAQIGYGGWGADYPSASGFIPPILSCAAFIPESGFNQNLAEFCDPKLDAKMERAASLQSQDPPAATLLWQEVEREILAQAPIVPATNPRGINFLSQRVGNYQYNPQWGPLLSQLWVQ